MNSSQENSSKHQITTPIIPIVRKPQPPICQDQPENLFKLSSDSSFRKIAHSQFQPSNNSTKYPKGEIDSEPAPEESQKSSYAPNLILREKLIKKQKSDKTPLNKNSYEQISTCLWEALQRYGVKGEIISKVNPCMRKSKYALNILINQQSVQSILAQMFATRKFKRQILLSRANNNSQKLSNFKALRVLSQTLLHRNNFLKQ